jgi:osmotically inducible lipoprotein OsmB
MKKIMNLALLVSLVAFSTGCASMTPTEQRLLSGGAIGAGAGAAIGAATGGSPAVGAAVGGAAGVVGGALVDQYQKSQGRP